MRMDEVQPYMLPWDAQHLSACCSLLAPGLAQLGTLEPSLFPTPEGKALEAWPSGEFPNGPFHANLLPHLPTKWDNNQTGMRMQ